MQITFLLKSKSTQYINSMLAIIRRYNWLKIPQSKRIYSH